MGAVLCARGDAQLSGSPHSGAGSVLGTRRCQDRRSWSDTNCSPLICCCRPSGSAVSEPALQQQDPAALSGSHLVALSPSPFKGCPHPLSSSLRCANTRGTFETTSQKAAAPVCFASKSLHRAVSAANSLSPGPYSRTFNLPDSSLAVPALR